MFRLVPPDLALSAVERFALDTLIDLSRVLRADGGVAVGVPLTIRGAVTEPPTPAQARGRRWGIEVRDAGVEIERPLLALVAELVTARAEQRTDAADHYGRVPPTENVVVRHGEERDPIVNRIALALRAAGIAAADRRPFALVAPWPDGKRWAVAITHDLDVVALWPAYSAMRVAELVSHGDLARALRVAGRALVALRLDPVWRAATHVMNVERLHRIRSTWFVIAGTPTLGSIRAGDVTYRPESGRARAIVDEARHTSFEIGLHGSFASFTSPREFTRQRERLGAIAGGLPPGVRQHFLRLRPGVTHRAMTEAGFTYDSTTGFSERNGFRLGVADVVPVWDDRDQRALQLDEAPFVWMDRALSKYRSVENPSVWIADALAIAQACREVEGLWTGIWHPNMDDALGFPDAPAAFESLVSRLISESPWCATLSEIVAWRRARRGARGLGVTASGEIRLRTAPTVPVSVPGPGPALEDPSGIRLPHVSA